MNVGPDLPDYSRPSVDLERRAGAEWQWGVTHTVRPEKLAPMLTMAGNHFDAVVLLAAQTSG